MIYNKKIAIVTRCMDRLQYLVQSLPTWLAVTEIDSITITDWSSKEDILPAIDKLNDSRISVIKVQNKTTFERSKAHNVGIRYTQADLIFLLDCDVMITNVKLLDNIKINENEFYTVPVPIGLQTDNVPEKCIDKLWMWRLYGNCIFLKHQWEKVNGFCEKLVDYGIEDIDFYTRLKKSNQIEQRVLTKNMLYHIPHKDELRSINHKEKNINKSRQINLDVSNKLVSNKNLMERQNCIVYHNKLSQSIAI
jgi:predicted glycosyltransferase involved in capsule biosynthesis